MSLTYGFYNSVGGDRKYDATDMAAIFNGIIKDGVYATVGGALAITPGGGMTINVAEGRAWFHGTWTQNDSVMTLNVEQAGLGLNRIDVVVLEVNKYTDVRANTIKILKGTPSATPAPPVLVNDEMLHQIPLAHISVNAGITAITGALITNYIGTGVCPFVTGVLSTVDVDMLLAQWDVEFNTWFATLVDILDENTAANLLNMINTKLTKPSGIIDGSVLVGTAAGEVVVKNMTELKALLGLTNAFTRENYDKFGTDRTVSFTLDVSDANTFICMNSASSPVIVIPTGAVAIPVGSTIVFQMTGTGTLSFTPSSGVTLQSKDNKRTVDGQYSWVTLKKKSDTLWLLAGALKA